MIAEGNCAGCKACIPACPQKAIYADDAGAVKTDRRKCNDCFACVGECYFNVRHASAKPYTPEELFKELIKDEVVFRTSGGGITLSGGEPTQNIEFCNELLTLIKNAGVHTAMETCGQAKWEDFKKIYNKVDLFLYDIKMIDSKKHRQWTGAGNAVILDNARKLAEAGAHLVIRVPLIPGVNDTREEFTKIAEFAAGLKNVYELHILPFHQVGASKYDMTGIEYTLRDWDEENTEKAQECMRIAENAGLRVSIGGTGFASERMHAFEQPADRPGIG